MQETRMLVDCKKTIDIELKMVENRKLKWMAPFGVLIVAAVLADTTNNQPITSFLATRFWFTEYTQNRIPRVIERSGTTKGKVPVVHLGGSSLFRGVTDKLLEKEIPALKGTPCAHLVVASAKQSSLVSLDLLELLIQEGFRDGVVVLAWGPSRLNRSANEMLLVSSNSHQFPWKTLASNRIIGGLRSGSDSDTIRLFTEGMEKGGQIELLKTHRKGRRESLAMFIKECLLLRKTDKMIIPLTGKSEHRMKLQEEFYNKMLRGGSDKGETNYLELNLQILSVIGELCKKTSSTFIVIETPYHQFLSEERFSDGMNDIRTRLKSMSKAMDFISVNANDYGSIEPEFFYDYVHVTEGEGQELNSRIYALAINSVMSELGQKEEK